MKLESKSDGVEPNVNGKMNGKVKKKKGKRKNPGSQGKKDVLDMSVDDMFSMIQDDDSDVEETNVKESSKKGKKKKKASSKKKKSNGASQVSLDDMDDEDALDDLDAGKSIEDVALEGEDSFEEDEDMAGASNLSRKEYLEKLKSSDPEFYATLMQSDDLLDLKSSDEEGEGDSAADDDDDDDNDNVDKNDDDGEGSESDDDADVAEKEDSDSLDDEDMDDYSGEVGNVTLQMIADWETKLQSKTPLSAFLDVQQAFLAAIESLSGGKKEKKETTSKYTVKSPQIFNAIVRMCLKYMAPALRTIFKINDPSQAPCKSKNWKKYKFFIKLYLRQLVALTEVVTDPTVAEAVLRNGVLPLIPFYAGYQNLSKLLSRRLIVMWATSDKKVRVLAFMALFRLTQIFHGEFLDWMLKKMYLTYVQNCRFTSSSTWGLIDFMRLSLVELYSLDHARAYRQAFMYIRQMAIHLRNATLHHKKEQVQLVYNWQYIHCLNLWCDLMGKTNPNTILQPMIFPVTQVAIGTLKLQQTPTFLPLAFHVCRMLTDLSRNTSTFIPVMPFLLDILSKSLFIKRPKKSSVKPYDWMCMLKLSRAETKESAFRDGVTDQVYDGMVNYLSVVSSSIGFPDFVVPTVMQLKEFLKKCKSPNYTKKFKQLLDKINENSAYIEERRKNVTFGIADSKAVTDWEISVKQAGTPLIKHYENWRKIREKEQQQRVADSISVKDFDLPSKRKRQLNKKEGLDDMFASDEEDEEDEELPGELSVRDSNAKVEKEEKDDNEDDDDNDDDEEEEEDDDETVPPKKKAKTQEKEEEEEEESSEEEIDTEDLKVPHNGQADVVREFNFSDLEDDGPDDDDYGADSGSES